MKKTFSLENFIYLAIVAMPAYLWKISFLGVPTNMFELMASVAVIWFVIERRTFKIALRGYEKYFIPIVMIMGGLALGTLFGGSVLVGLGIIKSWFIIPMVFAFVALEATRREKSGAVLEATYISALLVASVALVYFFLGEMTYDGRLKAFYNSPNYLAMFLAPAIIIGGAFFAKRKAFYAISLPIILSALYLTFSYAAWLAVFVAAGGLVFLNENGWKKWKSALFLGLVAGIIIFFQIGTSKFDGLVRLEDRSSLASRMMIWNSAGKMIVDNAFLGIGPGNFQDKYLEYQKYFPPYLEWAVPQPHNLFLAFWLQAGLAGLAGFLAILVLWFRDLSGSWKKEVDWGAAAIIIYILVHGIFDTTYFKNDLAVLFWLSFFVGIKKSSELGSERKTTLRIK
ncbi:MAG: O-antigen ligase family protein [Candidatus Moranbacteria bacterium]|nr:O-antigen ligase family protein [Candidatus Moranbacteria bacterium]